MIPIPQYPLYSATITLCNGRDVPYLLVGSTPGPNPCCYPHALPLGQDEAASWSVTPEVLRESLAVARAAGTDVRAMCVINPGNPTGQVLTEDNMREVGRVLGEGLAIFGPD